MCKLVVRRRGWDLCKPRRPNVELCVSNRSYALRRDIMGAAAVKTLFLALLTRDFTPRRGKVGAAAREDSFYVIKTLERAPRREYL